MFSFSAYYVYGWLIKIRFFFRNPLMPVRVAEVSAEDWAATHYGPLSSPSFRLVEASSDSIRVPQFSHSSVLLSSHNMFSTFAS